MYGFGTDTLFAVVGRRNVAIKLFWYSFSYYYYTYYYNYQCYSTAA